MQSLVDTHEARSTSDISGTRSEGSTISGYATVYLRLALGTAFLSAVADRFGVWGPPGMPLVAWGNFHNFLLYTAKLNPWFPASWTPEVGWIATLCEGAFGIALVLGFRTRLAALLSGLMSVAFALAMTLTLGIKAPLNYSVFTASAASFLLACMGVSPFSLDSLLAKSSVPSQDLRPPYLGRALR